MLIHSSWKLAERIGYNQFSPSAYGIRNHFVLCLRNYVEQNNGENAACMHPELKLNETLMIAIRS